MTTTQQQARKKLQEPRDSTVMESVRSKAIALQKRDRRERVLLPIGVLLGVIILWEVMSRVQNVNPLFFSYPSKIIVALFDYAGGDLWTDLATSSTEFVLGMSIALLGIPLGLVIGRNRRLVYAFDPIIDALYSTPMVALTPLFIIWFGLGLQSKIALVAVIAFFPLIITMIEGVKTVDRVLVDAARTFGATRRQVYSDVIVPGTLPFIVSGLRLSIRAGVIGVVLGEFIGAFDGVGYRIRIFASVFRTADYLAGIVVLITLAVGLNLLLKAAERRVAPWRQMLIGL